MKKIFLLAVIAVSSTMFTSCKKDYTCKCTYTGSSGSISGTEGSTNNTKKKANDYCDALEASSAYADKTCEAIEK